MNDELPFSFGIELETAYSSDFNYDDMQKIIPPSFKSGTDGTAGLEFRSAVFQSEKNFDDIYSLCDSVRSLNTHWNFTFKVTQKRTKTENYSHPIHGNCGLHVHIGFKNVDDLGGKYRIFRFISCYENLIYDLHNPWRSRRRYCKVLTPEHWESFRNGMAFSWWKTSKDHNDPSRFWWFNGRSMFKHGTIEFRLMNGTTNAEHIIGWISLLQLIFNSVVVKDLRLEWNDPNHSTLEHLLEDIKPTDAQSKRLFKLAKRFVTHYPKEMRTIVDDNSSLRIV